MTETTGTEVLIKIRAFPYYTDKVDPVTDRPVRQENVAVRGDKVVLSDVDLERAKRFDAILVDEDGDPVTEITPPVVDEEAEVTQPNLETASAEEISVWLKKEKPTVDEVVAASNENVEVSKKLIEAENLATGNQPRKSLVERLDAIIDANSGTGD